MTRHRLAAALLAALLGALVAWSASGADEKATVALRIKITDAGGEPVPCRIHLFDPAGKPVAAPGQPFWKDHFVCPGRVALRVAAGRYRYEIERGPEHQRISGALDITPGHDHTLHVRLDRFADLARQGWYSGDLHVHRQVKDIELLMKAEDLHVAPVITWWNARNFWASEAPPRELLRTFDGNRFAHLMAGEDERGGGALLFFNLKEPLPIAAAGREQPSALSFLRLARKRNPNVWVDIEKPFWWDVPFWLASGQVDSLGIAHNHMWRRGVSPTEAWGRPRDQKHFPGPTGNGMWTQEIYYHALNCGLRLPPSAGSASGVLPNPVGHNRVYVQVEGDLTYDKWWQGLKAGRCFVTNGPLLLCSANGKAPGHVFRGEAGKGVEVALDWSLRSQDRVSEVEVIRDGRVVEKVKVADSTSSRGGARLSFAESGWFLVRARADDRTTFRFASTGPFYVEVGKDARRVSKRSAKFFLDWSTERLRNLEKAVPEGAGRAEVITSATQAVNHWRRLHERARAD
jgi:hypothetical protein